MQKTRSARATSFGACLKPPRSTPTLLLTRHEDRHADARLRADARAAMAAFAKSWRRKLVQLKPTTGVEATSILPSLNAKTASLWRDILPSTHLVREGRMTVTIGRRELLAALGGNGGLAACGTGAAAGAAGDRLSQQQVTRGHDASIGRVSSRSGRWRLHRAPECDDRISLGARPV